MIFQVSVCVSVCPRARAPACLFSAVIKSFIISRASASFFFVFFPPLFVFVKSSSALSFIPDRRLQPAAATVLLAFSFSFITFYFVSIPVVTLVIVLVILPLRVVRAAVVCITCITLTSQSSHLTEHGLPGVGIERVERQKKREKIPRRRENPSFFPVAFVVPASSHLPRSPAMTQPRANSRILSFRAFTAAAA